METPAFTLGSCWAKRDVLAAFPEARARSPIGLYPCLRSRSCRTPWLCKAQCVTMKESTINNKRRNKRRGTVTNHGPQSGRAAESGV
ncbi:hypothetical protein NDU88_002110 [Pleurodeles waltl]|uniref:Uncharacterized protein n=1 Tax=Pleurodeles waltl TaxID=8319 RepID=A0AAV7RDJ8_PLEWA|nr:hypothetical protein NDU88_002110 [Pleurodeles waltl]